MITDAIILRKIKKQDMNAVIDWFDSRRGKFYKIGWAYLKNHHDVEDVFHNTILKVHDKISQLKEDKYFDTWVTTIFINECRDLYRKNKRKAAEQIGVLEDMSEFETKIQVFDGLEKLDEKYKEVIILKYVRGYSQDEIAEILMVPIGTVKSRIYRGLLLLRNAIEGGEGHEM
ncbi:RNA polymerase sigma factor [Bacillus sp. REN16]|uniref:RNA polymerase sigma factor n=1 Tax=Bacillus sp. REN16 TaxID=2887296 RepID=UPI001E5F7E20|nr:RNA polymerase sigma factor [Bacillus sp. REN16]MCC3356066.1 RNA polymerase sigma factor [Bacillus sp. REN16]